MEKTLYLEAAREGGRLQISIRERVSSDLDPSIDPYEVKALSMEQFAHIEKECLKAMDFLGASFGKGGITHQAHENLRKMGELLSDELLTPKIKEAILHSNASFLMIRIDDQMVQIPWELICLDGVFLCERFNLGRLVRTRQEVAEPVNRRPSFPISLWILANPGRNLASADKEGELILKIADTLNPEDMTIVNASLDSANATPEQIRFKIKNSDLVHFAGHAEYNPQNISNSGWKLADSYFSPTEIDQMAGGSKMPAIVFSNACRSARTGEWKEERNSFGIVNAFLRAGVQYYIGTAWEIMDRPSTLFACEFYNRLFSGSSIGEAVRLARKALKERYASDYVGWAGYILYGDPRYKLFDMTRDGNALLTKEKILFSETDDTRPHIRGVATEPTPVISSSGEKKAPPLLRNLLIVAIACGFMAWGISLFQKKIDMDLLKLNRDSFFKEKERNDLLIENIRKNSSETDSPRGRDSRGEERPAMALLYDSGNPKAGIIASEIKKALRARSGKIIFVERQELTTLLEEVNLALALPSRKKLDLSIVPADYILKLNLPSALTGTDITLLLFSTKEGEQLLQEGFSLIGRKKMPEEVIGHIIDALRQRKE